MIEIYGMETRFLIQSMRLMTYRSKVRKKGLEPDKCYHVARRIPKPLNRPAGKATNLVPPDLVFEVDVFGRLPPRLPVYAALDVREIWRRKSEKLGILVLEGDR
jgi:Uma2 family endonuclease